MQKTVIHKATSNIKSDEYENLNTGDTLLDDSKGGQAKIVKETGTFQIDSDNYVVFDSNAVSYLCRELPKAEMARVMKIGNMVYGDCSIVCKKEDRTAHSSETLATALDMSINKFYIMIRKLVKKGILSYCVCAPSGYVQKIYMLNPYIARKRKSLNCELISFFRDVTKE